MPDLEFTLKSNAAELKKATDEAIKKGLEMIGMQASSYAKLELEADPRRIDTGLLRNSITYAVYGESAGVSNYSADKPDETGEVKTGSYNGQAPADPNKVYVGTNVEYAAYVHEGTTRMAPNPFLKNAFEKHKDQYKPMFEDALKNA